MPMKKVIIIIASLIFIISASYVSWLWIKDLITFDRYVNEKEGISIKYPKGWTVVSNLDTGAIVAFVKPKANALVLFQANWNISATRLVQAITLEQYVKAADDQMKFAFKDVITSAEPMQLSGHKGYKLVYVSHKEDGLVFITFVFIYKDVAYNVTYADGKEAYSNSHQKQIIADIIGSLKVNF